MKTRNCYCGQWDPLELRRQGVPAGFCGLCETCGRAGHARHFPGALAYTGAWCDKHYRRLGLLHPAGHIGGFLWFGVAAAVIAAAYVVLSTV